MKKLSVLFFMAFCLFVSKRVQTMEVEVNQNLKALIVAAYNEDEAGVKKYLPLVDDPNTYLKKEELGLDEKVKFPLNALSAAAFTNKNDDIIYLLLAPERQNITPKRKINVNAAEPLTGMTPIFFVTLGDNKTNMITNLVGYGADPNHVDAEGNTPLHIAVKKNQMLTIRTLIINGATLNIQNKNGKTPIDIANTENVKEFLEEGGAKEREQENEEKLKNFIKAAWENDINTITELLKDSFFRTKNLTLKPRKLGIEGREEELNALMAAAIKGHLAIVKRLLKPELSEEKPVFIDFQNKSKDTALMLIIAEQANKETLDSKLLEVFKYLLTKNPDLNLQNSNGETVTHLAVDLSETQKEYLEALLAHDPAPDLTIEDTDRMTPLQKAQDAEKETYAKMLEKEKKEKKPKENLKNFIKAAWENNIDVIKEEINKKKLDVNATIKTEELGIRSVAKELNALTAAALRGNLEIVKELVEKAKANIDIQNNKEKNTVLMSILKRQNISRTETNDKLLKVFNYLLTKKPNLNLQNVNKKTVTHLAVNLPAIQKEYLTALLAQDPPPDLTIMDEDKKTPFKIAVEQGKYAYYTLIQVKQRQIARKPTAPTDNRELLTSLATLTKKLDSLSKIFAK